MKKTLSSICSFVFVLTCFCQSTKERIESAGTYYFVPMEKVKILIPLKNYPTESSIDYRELAEMEITPSTEFDYAPGFYQKTVRTFGYVEDLDAAILRHINNFAYQLIDKEIEATLVRTTKDKLNDEEPYFYFSAGVSSQLVNRFIIGNLKEDPESSAVNLRFEVFVRLDEHRPSKATDKNIYFDSKAQNVSQKVEFSVEKKSVPKETILEAYKELKMRMPDAIKACMVKIEENAEKKLSKKLSK